MKPYKRVMIFAAVTAVLASCGRSGHSDDRGELFRAKSAERRNSPQVIMVVADSLMYQTIDKGIRQGKLPAIGKLIEDGQYYTDVVSSFPTMSVTIDSSLLTGTYPDKHLIPGLIWYSKSENRVVNYGTGPIEIFRQGLDPVLTDAAVHLNGRHLSPRVKTIYEELADRGLKSGSVNGLVYRGKTAHTLKIPPFIRVPTSLPSKLRVMGPDLLALGAFTNPVYSERSLPDGITRNMGFNNAYSIETVKHLIRTDRLPDFLYVYLPDLDQRLHRKGPFDLEGAVKLDGQLSELRNAFRAGREPILIVIGDSGMSYIGPAGKRPVIDLTDLLSGRQILRPGESPTADTDIVLAVNETMAYVYRMNDAPALRELAGTIRADARIDLAAWEEDGWIHVTRSGMDGELRYRPDGPATDRYGQAWTIEGDMGILDLKRAKGGKLEYGDYPDSLRRLLGAFRSHEGEFLIVTSKPGYELVGHSSPTHRNGGGHGSLHRVESLVPLIVLGTDEKPSSRRIVDMKSYVLRLLNQEQR